MNKDLIAIFDYMERERGIPREAVIEAVEEALRLAARKSIKGSANVTVKIHPKTGDIEVYTEKEIVDQVDEPSREISLDEAREIDPDCQIGQFIDVTTTPKDFGRIAAQKARQVIAQKLRSAERNIIYEEYRHRVHELVTGTVKRLIRGNNVVIDLGKVSGLMPMRHYPKSESYHPGDKVLAMVYAVQDTEDGGAEVVLTRSDSEFVRQLLIQEVPELADGTVLIDKIVRDPGYRTKLTVRATDPKVDPVGACVGMRGVRIKNVVRELHNEKVDIIPYSADAVELLQNALNPIEIRKINMNDEARTISIVVDDDAFAVVLGKRGMNARLNGDLIGFHLEVQRMSDYNKLIAVQRIELAETENPLFDETLNALEGISPFVVEHLAGEGYTLRSLLRATPAQLVAIPGISAEMAEKILEQARRVGSQKLEGN